MMSDASDPYQGSTGSLAIGHLSMVYYSDNQPTSKPYNYASCCLWVIHDTAKIAQTLLQDFGQASCEYGSLQVTSYYAKLWFHPSHRLQPRKSSTCL